MMMFMEMVYSGNKLNYLLRYMTSLFFSTLNKMNIKI